MDSKITLENFEYIWSKILIKATDTYNIPAEVIHVENFADLVRWQLQKVDPHIGAVA